MLAIVISVNILLLSGNACRINAAVGRMRLG